MRSAEAQETAKHVPRIGILLTAPASTGKLCVQRYFGS